MQGGWLHPEIMQAACKVKKEKPDAEATLSCSNPLHTGQGLLFFFFFNS